MGRSQMQGTPWHYEYVGSKGNGNSKHCVYNVGYCSNKYSQYHKQKCEGREYCEDFDRSDFAKSDLNQQSENKKTKSKKNQLTNKKSDKNGPANSVKCYKEYPVTEGSVKLGDKVSVINCSTKNTVTFNIKNPKDPYIGKKIGEIVGLKSANYKIVKIKRRQEKNINLDS